MELKCLKWLDDVWQATELIQQVTKGISEADYLRDRFLRCGVERNFEIIGEALNRIRKADPALAAQIFDIDKIRAFRNLIIHGYNLIRDEDVGASFRTIFPSLPICGSPDRRESARVTLNTTIYQRVCTFDAWLV